jgi:hypothetical protein
MSAVSGLYNLSELLVNPRITVKYVLGDMSLADRVNMWNTDQFTMAQKVDMLDMAGCYILLEAKRGFTNEKDYSIIDFNMFDSSGKELFRNFDYELSTNKVYLFGEIATPSTEKHLIITDIAIDFNTPADLMGKSIHVPYNDAVTKNEYNEILKMLMGASLGGPTVSNLKSAIKAISGFDQGDLYDKFTRDALKQKRWKKHNYTDFDFVVVFPEEYASNMEKLQMIIDYLKLVKPAYTKFFVILQSLYSDLYNIIIRANDAYHMDYALEHTDDDADLTIDDESQPDHITETMEDVYSVVPVIAESYRLNSITGRLNVNFYLFGSSHIDELDVHVMDYITEHLSDIYLVAIDDEDHNIISHTDDESYDASITDETAATILIDIVEEPYLATMLDEMVADNFAEVFSDAYNSSGIIEEDGGFALVETPTEESYNNVIDDSDSTTVSTNTSIHYRLNSTQQLNVEIRTERITDVVVYNY